jgi:hypothetical protein
MLEFFFLLFLFYFFIFLLFFLFLFLNLFFLLLIRMSLLMIDGGDHFNLLKIFSLLMKVVWTNRQLL